jgi:anti-anti-sigma factor
MLRVDIQSSPSNVTLHCCGRVVLGVESETLRGITTSRPEPHISLDLSRVNGIDAAGLGLLVELHRWSERRSTRLTIANPSPSARKLIALTSLDRVLHIVGGPVGVDLLQGVERWQGMTA